MADDLYQRPGYLDKYTRSWTIRDRRVVTLRPISPDDRPIEKDLIEGLSPESSRYRFFDRVKEATPEMLRRFCDIDYRNEMAIIAEFIPDGGKSNVGVGRLIIEPEIESGEFAIVVSDDFHGQGLGRKLMEMLIEIGRERNLKSLYGTVLVDNWKMLRMVKKLGFREGTRSHGEVKVVLELRPADTG